MNTSTTSKTHYLPAQYNGQWVAGGGNTRLTFTTAEETLAFEATMESEYAFGSTIGNAEQGQLIYGTLEEIIAATAGYDSGDDLNAPKAYLQYILFDTNFMPVPVDEGMLGYRSITEAAMMTSANDYENIYPDPLAIDNKEGFIYIYLANESNTDINVFFDDLKIDLIKSPIVQADDYYPFGLSFNSYKRENSMANKFKYNYAFDNPIRFIDPDGMVPEDCCGGSPKSLLLDEAKKTWDGLVQKWDNATEAVGDAIQMV